jgi:hypothetical protein
MIIDKRDSRFNDIPDTLEGEVLLERLPNGMIVTATVEMCRDYKLCPTDLQGKLGVAKWKATLDGLDTTSVPTPNLTASRALADRSVRDHLARRGLPLDNARVATLTEISSAASYEELTAAKWRALLSD